MYTTTLLSLAGFGLLSFAQNLIRDPSVYGPALEVVHLYYDEFPTGSCAAIKKDIKLKHC